MTTEFIRFKTADGFELHGLLSNPRNQKATRVIIHVHGLAGNFYENRFVHEIAARAISEGIAFFSFNNRGHGHISDILRETEIGIESVRLGGAYEKFHDCLFDIDAALAFMSKTGIQEVVLQGHSSGANKIVFHHSQRNDSIVKGLVLISPCDDVGLQHDATMEKAADLLELAQKMVAEGKGSVLMPDGSFFTFPMSASTYVDYFRPGSDQDVFPYRNPNDNFPALGSVQVPILVTFGQRGDYVLGSLEETCDLLKRKAKKSPSFRSTLISQASHTYSGKEDALATEIISWVGRL